MVKKHPIYPVTATLCVLFVPVFALWSPGLVQAQDALVLSRLTEPIELDGLSNETAWQDIEPFPLTMNLPSFGGEHTERTEIRIAFDDDYLYAAGRFYDSNPSGIRGNSLSRDRASDSDDFFAVILDTFNDNENALAFMTTPAGIRIDQAVYNDAEFDGDNMPVNESWNTFWDVATVTTEEGWFAEVRIPFSSLRFQDVDGRVVMGLMTWRWIARKSEGHTFPEAPPKWFLSHIKPSIMQDVVLEGIYGQKPIYVTPYALGGLNQTTELNTAETAYDRHDDPTEDIGLDVKYSLTSNLTLDVTANTDFAQVEADDQQVNLTRFSLFFPEKRQFFQERSSVFDFNTGGQTRLFYSRRIGLSEDGPVRIFGGARLVGRIGRWDVGFMDMQTARLDTIPSENFGVLRLRRQVFNENSYAGGMVTSRIGTDGSYAFSYGLDGVVRVLQDDYVTFSLAHTFDDVMVNAGDVSPVRSGLFRARWERRSSQGLGYLMEAKSSGADFDPSMGFALRTDVTRLEGQVSYSLLPGEQSPFFKHMLAFEGSSYLRHEDGSLESAELGPFYVLSFRSGAFMFVSPKVLFEDLSESFELSDDTLVPAGSHTFFSTTLFYQPPPNLFRTGLFVDGGTFYDGWRITAGLSPTWTLSRYLELSGEYQLNRVGFPDRDQRFSADIFRLRAKAALNNHLSAGVFAQYNSASDAVILNVRLRYNFREGNDLYIVYNEAFNTDRHAADPHLPFTDTRTILVKYTYTLAL
ncbi:MAG: DUF5916 domain-containing protein [Rhodothermales bacterium]